MWLFRLAASLAEIEQPPVYRSPVLNLTPQDIVNICIVLLAAALLAGVVITIVLTDRSMHIELSDRDPLKIIDSATRIDGEAPK